jgi:hypothetical protein
MYMLQFFSAIGEIKQWAQWLNLGGRTVLLHWGFTRSLCQLTPRLSVPCFVTTVLVKHKHGFITLDDEWYFLSRLGTSCLLAMCWCLLPNGEALRALASSMVWAAVYSSWIYIAHFFIWEHAHGLRGRLKSWKLSHPRCNGTVARGSKTLIHQRVGAYLIWNRFFLPIVLQSAFSQVSLF